MAEEVNEFDKVLMKSENFVEDNQKPILIGLVAVILVVIGALYYFMGYMPTRNQEASEAMFKAEHAFEADSFKLALNGNGATEGFLSIIDDYSGTDAANAAKAYAGVCYKNMGDTKNALSYLEDFSASDGVVKPAIYGAIGDCYWDENQTDKAIENYKKAIDSKDKLVSPIYMKRLGLLYYQQNKKDDALAQFQQVKDEYSESIEAQDIDKFISLCGK
ncbi:MAG: DUF4810 domain-containing protein [Paludibacteraceae bacterium]|jgi:predicted negative regulator of RcsB-dependent stress response|nr:DUF4810 domain-containing protein [Paludibacteraceae bacterium]